MHLKRGGLYTVQLEAGKQHNFGLQIDFTGTDGDLKIENAKSFGNREDNTVWGASGSAGKWQKLEIPKKYNLPECAHLDASVQDLAYLYARHLGMPESGDTAPTFADE